MEGLKLANDIFKRRQEQHGSEEEYAYPGVLVALLVLSDPRNSDLWERTVSYCGEKKEEA